MTESIGCNGSRALWNWISDVSLCVNETFFFEISLKHGFNREVLICFEVAENYYMEFFLVIICYNIIVEKYPIFNIKGFVIRGFFLMYHKNTYSYRVFQLIENHLPTFTLSSPVHKNSVIMVRFSNSFTIKSVPFYFQSS